MKKAVFIRHEILAPGDTIDAAEASMVSFYCDRAVVAAGAQIEGCRAHEGYNEFKAPEGHVINQKFKVVVPPGSRLAIIVTLTFLK